MVEVEDFMYNPTNDQMRNASPSIFDAQDKPSEEALEQLRKWRDQEAEDEWTQEALDATIEWLEEEVK